MAPKDLVELLIDLGYEQAVLTDVNATSACLDFVRLSQQKGLRPLLGVDFRNSARQQFVAIAQSNKGFKEINTYLSYLKHEQQPVPERAPEFQEVFVVYPFATFTADYGTLRPNEFVGVSPKEVRRLKFSKAKYAAEKLVLFHSMTFRNKRDFNTHRLLRAVDKNLLLSKLPKTEEAPEQNTFVSYQSLLAQYIDYPEIVQNTERLLEQCSIHFDFGDDIPHQNKKTYTGNEQADCELVHRLCEEGLPYRYPKPSKQIKERLVMELKIIRQKGFLAYFLMSWDICKYARSKNYFYVGRGSGANSMVAYILRITDVDPIELDLYFERFINLFRRNPPDFDIDFSWKDRQDVTAYIFKRFGYEHTALLGAYVTFQYRAVVRELGKVFGLPKLEIDKLADARVNPNKLDQMSMLVLKYGQYIQEMPNYLSIHSAGIIISEHPIHWFTATDLPPKGFATTHFDMVVAEDVGLYKYDILGQRGLGKIKDALTIIEHNKPSEPPIDIHDIKRFKEDEAVKDMLSNGKAIGCFYVESPAMRMLLTKLHVRDYLSLVAASSVIRPGVSQSGMMRTYIERFRDPKKRKDAHPVMLEIMPDTFGVMVYQEDVIKVAHYFAGLSLGEADVLRRGMSGKYRSREEFQQVREKFFSNCKAKGYGEEMAAEIWRQIESFAGYAFAKGHSASYAVESYQSLFLKAHYPLEYMVATLNNGGGFYRPEFYVHEARMYGAQICAPCVNHSRVLCTIEGKDVYLGLGFIHGMEGHLAGRIVQEREANGAYASLEDFIDRLGVTVEDIAHLIRIDGFRFTTKSRRELLWKAHLLLGTKPRKEPEMALFQPAPKNYDIPTLQCDKEEDLFDQLELLGFPLQDPWLLIKDKTPYPLRAQDLPAYLGKVITIQGYLVTAKNTKTVGGKSMYFGTFIDRDGHWIDSTHFPQVAQKFPFRGRGVYTLTGTVVKDFDVLSIEVIRMEKEAYISDPRYAEDGKSNAPSTQLETLNISRQPRRKKVR